TALSQEGDGIVTGGKTAFVGGALPGETVSFLRRRRFRQYDKAELLERLSTSPLRVTPQCAHFGLCGGCALQHLDSAAQLTVKEQQLREALERIGRVTPRQWLAPLAGPIWHYRRRARLGVRFVPRKQRVVIGFRERYSSLIALLEGCEVLAPPVGALLIPLGELVMGLSVRERLPQIEVAVAESATALVLRVLDPPTVADEAKLRAFEAAHEVRFYLQAAGLESIRPLSLPAPELSYTLPEFGLTLQFEPADFIQVNALLNRALVGRVVELLELNEHSQVLDLFCGLGNFTLALARRAGAVVGVEVDAGLIARARANAHRNGLPNAEFCCANLAPEAPDLPSWPQRRYSHVLLDPPRAGAAEVLPALGRLGADRIMYVSCHPGTLARDLGVLVHEYGYQLQCAGVADMFAQTAHVESLALLTRS
ncbi:MAG TPA: 23S rRNA (uracil(1939)-C(5))-methyltransferase RlmD, partial [Steroidobacteraceae bacterium]